MCSRALLDSLIEMRKGFHFSGEYSELREQCINEIYRAIREGNWFKAHNTIQAILKYATDKLYEEKIECSYIEGWRLQPLTNTVYLRVDLVRMNFCAARLDKLDRILREVIDNDRNTEERRK